MNRIRVTFELLGESLTALRDNRLRSAMSVVGISIGIAAVMTVSAVSTGGRIFVMQELETFGLRSVWVFRDYADKDPLRRTRKGTGIEQADLAVLQGECCPSVRRFSPVVQTTKSPIVQRANRYSNGQIIGVDAQFLQINNDRLTAGRGFRPDDIDNRRPVALVSRTVVEDLFGNVSSPVGHSLRIAGRKYRVIGVLQYKSRDLLASIGSEGGEDANNRILLPYTLVQQLNGNTEISYLQAEAVSLQQAERAVRQLQGVLERRHRGVYQYKQVTMASYLTTVERILGGITVIGIVAASASLLVGGIGVAGIMSTAVVERIREIGVRMAIGANRRQILWQFLFEAVLISLMGGCVGLITGLILGGLLDLATDFPLLPTPDAILTGLMVSVLVGLASGYVPARRASNLLPVEALRRD